MVKIIIHGGNAHLDDFLSTCIVLYKEDNIDIIYRRDPTIEELNNSFDWKIDIGEEFNPWKRQFDHHLSKFPEIENLSFNVDVLFDCSLSLLLKYYNIWREANEVYKWIHVVVMNDCRGSKYVEDILFINRDIVKSLESFIERSILTIFENKEVIEKESSLFKLMKFTGKLFFDGINDYFEMIKTVNKHAEIFVIKDVVIIKYLHKPHYSKPLMRVLVSKKREWYPSDIGGIVIFPNQRPIGSIGLNRLNDDPRVDFRNIKDYDKLIFAHHSGFFAVVSSDISDDELKLYIEDSIK